MALYQTRQGELSSWKGCAGANASRNAVFAALLAQSGFSGAEAPIEGKYGLWDAVERFDWPLQKDEPPYRIARTHIKCFPICYHGQSAVWTALGMRDQVRVDDIEEIRIGTYRTAFNMMANDPSRWAPGTHETADHSLPYVVAMALREGAVNESSFTPGKLRDPTTADLMSRTSVTEDAALTAQFPESSPCHITVRLKDGSEISNDIRYPKGHDRSPMTASEVNDKFRGLFEGYGSRRQAERVIATVAELDQLQDIGELFARFQRRMPRTKSARVTHAATLHDQAAATSAT
jgi:2-methylcitrate dehydratase